MENEDLFCAVIVDLLSYISFAISFKYTNTINSNQHKLVVPNKSKLNVAIYLIFHLDPQRSYLPLADAAVAIVVDIFEGYQCLNDINLLM